jgi:hypothetical protein
MFSKDQNDEGCLGMALKEPEDFALWSIIK